MKFISVGINTIDGSIGVAIVRIVPVAVSISAIVGEQIVAIALTGNLTIQIGAEDIAAIVLAEEPN